MSGAICGPGRYRYLVRASCPWCCLGRARTVHAMRHVHAGYCAPDLVCGRCGQYWSADHDGPLRHHEGECAASVEMVRAMKRRLVVRSRFPLPPGI